MPKQVQNFGLKFAPLIVKRRICFQKSDRVQRRLMTTNSLHPCGNLAHEGHYGTNNEKVKNLALFSSIINGIITESHGLESQSSGSVFNSSIESKILSHLHRNKSNSQISQSDWYCRNRKVWA